MTFHIFFTLLPPKDKKWLWLCLRYSELFKKKVLLCNKSRHYAYIICRVKNLVLKKVMLEETFYLSHIFSQSDRRTRRNIGKINFRNIMFYSEIFKDYIFINWSLSPTKLRRHSPFVVQLTKHLNDNQPFFPKNI